MQSSPSEGYQTEQHFSISPIRWGLLSQILVCIVMAWHKVILQWSSALHWVNDIVQLRGTQRQEKGEGGNAHMGCEEATSVRSSLHFNGIKHFMNLHP